MRDQLVATSRYNYEYPPMVFWNEVELKIRLEALANTYGIKGSMDKDNGHNFSYAVIRDFPRYFSEQVIKNQFAVYDAVPSLVNPATLGAVDIGTSLLALLLNFGDKVAWLGLKIAFCCLAEVGVKGPWMLLVMKLPFFGC